MDRWHGKHPIPWDFFNTMNNASGKNLDWFWSNWFFSNNYIDLALEKVAKTGDGYTVTVKNIGGLAAPFDLEVHFAGGETRSFHQQPQVWQDHPKQVILPLKTGGKKVVEIILKNGIFMDANPADNKWKAS